MVCVADWVLIEDFGFFGGVGTDPNSMIPMALICVGGYLAMARVPVVADPDIVPIVSAEAETGSWRQRLITSPSYAMRTMAGLVAIGIVLIGGIPMGVAAASPSADPILATAVDGAPNALHAPAPAFNLIDQHGQAVSLAGLHGRTVALTFLDPVCTSDCPVIAQEFRQADQLLGAESKKVDMIAIDANPRYIASDDLLAFDAQEGLSHLSNWLYLTGSESTLQHIWNAYGVLVGSAPGGAMISHSDTAYVITPNGTMTTVLDADPGTPTSATKSSFAVTLADAIKSANIG